MKDPVCARSQIPGNLALPAQTKNIFILWT